jgi:hypothetical protein
MLVGITALPACCVPLYLSHNAAAKHLLANLLKLPLPSGATSGTRDWDIGAYEGASNLCEATAFIIIKSDAPKESVLDFYKTHFPASDREVDGEYYVASFDNLPQVEVPSEISDLVEHTAPDQRSATYAVWIILPIDEDSWDIRGW